MNAKLSVALSVAVVGVAQAQPPVELPPLTLTPPEGTVVPAKAVVPVAPSQSAPEVKVNGEAAKVFAAKIQPILTNRCADCHAHKDHASGFKLKWIEPGLNDPQGADANLRAAAKWLTPTTPHASPLLKYSGTAHGMATEPPLPVKHAAYKPLELWVHWACGPDGSAAPTAVPAPPAPVPAPVQQAAAVQPVMTPPTVVPAGGFAAAPPPAESKPNPNDPFDPAAFNRAMHPSRK